MPYERLTPATFCDACGSATSLEDQGLILMALDRLGPHPPARELYHRLMDEWPSANARNEARQKAWEEGRERRIAILMGGA